MANKITMISQFYSLLPFFMNVFFLLLQYCSILMEHFEIKITDQQILTLMLLPFNFRFSSKNRKFSHFYFFVLIENYNLVIFFPFSFSSPNSQVTILYVGTFIAGIVGNVIVCMVIIRHSTMHTATNYYLFNLAVSDLIYLLLGKYRIYNIYLQVQWCRDGLCFAYKMDERARIAQYKRL